MFTNIDKDKLLAGLDIERVAERLGIQVNRHKALCCFHDDKHPSLSFKNKMYTCFSCGESGGIIDFVMKLNNFEFVAACEWLNETFSCNAIEYINENIDNKEHRKTNRILQAAADMSRLKLKIIHQFLQLYQTKQFEILGDDTTAYEALCGEVYKADELKQSRDNETVITEAARLDGICRKYDKNYYEYLLDYDVRWTNMENDLKLGKEPHIVIDKFLKDSKKARKKYNCGV